MKPHYDKNIFENLPQETGEILRQAADRGAAHAHRLLGLIYYNGEGVPQNLAKAAELFQKAADNGDGPAQRLLGAIKDKKVQ